MTRTRITTDGLTDASVTTSKVADAAITDAKIAAVAAAKVTGQITTAQVADASITTAKVADGSITTAKIAENAVVTADIADAAITTAKIADAAITNAKVADGTITTNKITGLGTMATATATDYLARAGGTMTGQLVIRTSTSASDPGVAVSGDTNTGIAQVGGADTLGVVTGGVERWRVGADGATQSVIPGGSTLLPQFPCRAWVNFNGQGTPSIRAHGNVSSVTRVATGDYMVNFANAMPDTNFAAAGSCLGITGTTFGGRLECVPWATTQLRVLAVNSPGSAAYDSGGVLAAVFR